MGHILTTGTCNPNAPIRSLQACLSGALGIYEADHRRTNRSKNAFCCDDPQHVESTPAARIHAATAMRARKVGFTSQLNTGGDAMVLNQVLRLQNSLQPPSNSSSLPPATFATAAAVDRRRSHPPARKFHRQRAGNGGYHLQLHCAPRSARRPSPPSKQCERIGLRLRLPHATSRVESAGPLRRRRRQAIAGTSSIKIHASAAHQHAPAWQLRQQAWSAA